jgi:hypothetical protein
MTKHPTDEDLLNWRTPSEDNFVERKTSTSATEWVKTVVAFANSAPQDRCAVLYIGVRDDGSVEGQVNLDAVQKTLHQKLQAVFPAVEYSTRVLSTESKQFLCVLVPGSSNRPHFSGPAYVRVGSQSLEASKQQYDRLITERNSKASKILQYEGQPVNVQAVRSGREATVLGRVSSSSVYHVVGCNEFSATFRDMYGQRQVIALERIHILEDAAWPGAITFEVRND